MTVTDTGAPLGTTAGAPPDGFEVPAPVARLTGHAHAHGRRTLLQWHTTTQGAPFLTVQVGRRAEPADGPGPYWLYQLTWHSWDLPHGRLRLFRAGTAQTPTHPRAHDAPSVTKIRRVIADHPAPTAEPTMAQR